MALTVNKIRKLKEPGRYLDANGLYLQVLGPQNRSWIFRYQVGTRERWMGLGAVHTVRLDDARERARKARLLLLDGKDPLAERKAARAAQALAEAKTVTFAEAAHQYFDFHQSKWKNRKHAQQFNNTLKDYVFPKLGRLAVADIDTGRVLSCIEPIWKEKTETASRVRGRIEAVLDWATVRGFREGDNPARWAGHLAHLLPARSQIAKVQHHAAMPYPALPGFMTELAKRDGIAARALEFTISTAARTGEVIGARWSEIDLDAKLWTIPAGRMKGGRMHRVPLSDRAAGILAALPREADCDFVFIGSRKGSGLSNMTMSAVLKRMGRTDITTHGFRSSFRDWAAERTSYPNHVVEMALSHAIGNRVEAAYRRGELLDQRRRLTEAWARFCTTPTPVIDATVTPIRAAEHRR